MSLDIFRPSMLSIFIRTSRYVVCATAPTVLYRYEVLHVLMSWPEGMNVLTWIKLSDQVLVLFSVLLT